MIELYYWPTPERARDHDVKRPCQMVFGFSLHTSDVVNGKSIRRHGQATRV